MIIIKHVSHSIYYIYEHKTVAMDNVFKTFMTSHNCEDLPHRLDVTKLYDNLHFYRTCKFHF